MKLLKILLPGLALLLLAGAGTLLALGRREGAGWNTASVAIAAPPEAVFPWLTEPARLQRWVGGMVDGEVVTPGPVRPGSRSRETVMMGSERTEMVSTVTALEPGRALEVSIDGDGFRMDTRYEVEADGRGGTRLRFQGVTRYERPFPRLMEPVITPAAQEKLEEDLARLKALVEAEAGRARPAAPGA